MKAGKELDKLIGREVLDLKDELGFYIDLDCPHYSTDISAAWQIVEKLMEENWTFDLHNGSCGWHCEFVIGDTNSPNGDYNLETEKGCTWVESFGASASHAICLAALKARGIGI